MAPPPKKNSAPLPQVPKPLASAWSPFLLLALDPLEKTCQAKISGNHHDSAALYCLILNSFLFFPSLPGLQGPPWGGSKGRSKSVDRKKLASLSKRQPRTLIGKPPRGSGLPHAQPSPALPSAAELWGAQCAGRARVASRVEERPLGAHRGGPAPNITTTSDRAEWGSPQTLPIRHYFPRPAPRALAWGRAHPNWGDGKGDCSLGNFTFSAAGIGVLGCWGCELENTRSTSGPPNAKEPNAFWHRRTKQARGTSLANWPIFYFPRRRKRRLT